MPGVRSSGSTCTVPSGLLQDVRSIGGYVYAKNGRRYALYASVHGERNMAGGIRFLDKVVEWTYLQK